MLIISKQALRFERGIEQFEIRPNTATLIPEWVKDEQLFALADKDGLITYVEKSKTDKVVSEEPEPER